VKIITHGVEVTVAVLEMDVLVGVLVGPAGVDEGVRVRLGVAAAIVMVGVGVTVPVSTAQST
jgi:hypothetical protein